MRISVHIWGLALVCLLGSLVSGLPTDVQSDTYSPSNILGEIQGYAKAVVEKVESSTVWNYFRGTIDKVNGAMNVAGGYLYAYYEDHFKEPTDNARQWIKAKTEPIIESVKQQFQKESK